MSSIESAEDQGLIPFAVYLGRGNGVARKYGNRIYRQTIKKTKPIYRKARGNKAKGNIAKDLIKFIQKQGGTFYFKIKDDGAQEFVEAPFTIILSKVKQALREKYESSCEDNFTFPQVRSIIRNILDSSNVPEDHNEPEMPPLAYDIQKTTGRASIIDQDNTVKEAITWEIKPILNSKITHEEEHCDTSDTFDEHSFSSNDSSHHFDSHDGGPKNVYHCRSEESIPPHPQTSSTSYFKYSGEQLNSAPLPQLIKSDSNHDHKLINDPDDLLLLQFEAIQPLSEELNLNSLLQNDGLPNDMNSIFQECL